MHSRGFTVADTRTPAQRRLQAQIAANTRWAKVQDRTAATAPGRRAFENRFAEQARAQMVKENPGVTPGEKEVSVRAEALRRAYFLRLVLSATQRRQRKAQ